MISEFSSGYYQADMDIQEYDDGPVIQRAVYDFINKELYLDSDAPVMMRLGLDVGVTFEVGAEGAVPQDVLALPAEMIPDEDKEVFVLKAEYHHG